MVWGLSWRCSGNICPGDIYCPGLLQSTPLIDPRLSYLILKHNCEQHSTWNCQQFNLFYERKKSHLMNKIVLRSDCNFEHFHDFPQPWIVNTQLSWNEGINVMSWDVVILTSKCRIIDVSWNQEIKPQKTIKHILSWH